jgi:hypothetical protein
MFFLDSASGLNAGTELRAGLYIHYATDNANPCLL